MKSVIFYALMSGYKPNGRRYKVFNVGGSKVYVRAKLFRGDCVEALSKARPLDSETVLNTIEVHDA